MAVEKLVHEFDLSPGDFRNFMTEVQTRSDAVGFNTLYTIDVNNAEGPEGVLVYDNESRATQRESES